MANFAQGDVKAGKANIHYYRTGGDKPPLVLLHGATDNGLCWSRVAQRLAPHYDVIMPDAQGHGLSDRFGPESGPSDAAQQVIALIEELRLQHPVVMGHSMGAGTTVAVAVSRPHLPRAIILEDPGWQTLDESETAKEERLKMRDSFIQIARDHLRHSREELAAQCRRDNPRWSDEEVIPWAGAKLQFDPALFANFRPGMPSYAELVPQIVCPALLITSDAGIVTADVARHASQLWKSDQPFRWVRIEGAGHNIRREQFEQFMKAVTGFLHELEGQ